MLEKYDHFSYFNLNLYARGGNGMVSQNTLLKGGMARARGSFGIQSSAEVLKPSDNARCWC
jgi:hypothetical protein